MKVHTLSSNEKLIPINYESTSPTVSARDLHVVLEVATRYNDWFSQMRTYGFVEGKDFSLKSRKSTGGRPGMEHTIWTDFLKEIQ